MSSIDQLPDTLTYQSSWYREYRNLQGVDEVKKRLERDALLHVLATRGQKPGRLLDVGTATGRYPKLFARSGWHCIGLDVSELAVSLARAELTGAEFADRVDIIHGDIRTVRLAEGQLDLVICMMGTFAHIPAPDRAEALRTMCRLLRPGGHLVLSNWNPQWPNGRMLSLYGPAERRRLNQATAHPTQAVGMLAEAGFEQVALQHICPFTDSQIEHWIASHSDSPDRIQAYMMANDIAIPGQMFLVYGGRP